MDRLTAPWVGFEVWHEPMLDEWAVWGWIASQRPRFFLGTSRYAQFVWMTVQERLVETDSAPLDAPVSGRAQNAVGGTQLAPSPTGPGY